MILLLGAPAVRTVLSTEAGITRMRGRWHDWRGVPVMATFHPAALLRDPAKKREAWADLLLLRRRSTGAGHERPSGPSSRCGSPSSPSRTRAARRTTAPATPSSSG